MRCQPLRRRQMTYRNESVLRALCETAGDHPRSRSVLLPADRISGSYLLTARRTFACNILQDEINFSSSSLTHSPLLAAPDVTKFDRQRLGLLKVLARLQLAHRHLALYSAAAREPANSTKHACHPFVENQFPGERPSTRSGIS